MKITKVQIAKLSIPLIRPFITAVRRTEFVEDIVIMIHTDSENIGYGSAASTPLITGDTSESIISVIKNIIAPKLIGRDILEFNNLIDLVNNSCQQNFSAKAAVDIALHDLFAQICNLPLYRLLGGSKNQIDSCITISVKDIDSMVADANELVQQGFKKIKIKVGVDYLTDIQRIKAIRQALGGEVDLLVDANQGWQVKDAYRVIDQLNDLDILMVEQPVKANDLSGLKHIRDSAKIPVFADEACFSTQDCFNIAVNRVSDGVNIKLMKCGGIANAQAIYNIAKVANLRTMVGCMLESPIGVNAIASFASGKVDLFCADLDPVALIRANYVLGGISLANGTVVLSDNIGLGIVGFSDGLTVVGEV